MVKFVSKWGELRMKERRIEKDIHENQLVRQWAQGHLVVVADSSGLSLPTTRFTF